jgi:hypothetical protein
LTHPIISLARTLAVNRFETSLHKSTHFFLLTFLFHLLDPS